MTYSAREMMAVAIARQFEDGKTYIIGTGLPLIGAALAKATHAPDAHLIFETGIVDGDPQEVPTSVSDLRLHERASVFWPQYRYLGFEVLGSRRGKIAAGFLGGAQIDPYGNLNSTAIGDYHRPKSRFSGSGGANGIATYCSTIITMKHEIRRFVRQVDYITSPGWIDGPHGRENRGLPREKGPLAVISQLGIMRFSEDKRMYVDEIFPGVDPRRITENTGFDIDVSKAVQARPPDSDVLRILWNEIDPLRLMT